MHDRPRKRPNYRRAEVVATDLPVREVLEALEEVRSEPAMARFMICAITPTQNVCEVTKNGYKENGYRLNVTEAVMAATLKDVPQFKSEAEIFRVDDWDQAQVVNAAAGSKQILRCHLGENRPMRLYSASVDGQQVGWVRSINALPEATWVSNMFVQPAFRGRGIAKALMSRMLADDRELGYRHSVLTASHAGALLYPGLGYRQIGLLHGLTLKRR